MPTPALAGMATRTTRHKEDMTVGKTTEWVEIWHEANELSGPEYYRTEARLYRAMIDGHVRYRVCSLNNKGEWRSEIMGQGRGKQAAISLAEYRARHRLARYVPPPILTPEEQAAKDAAHKQYRLDTECENCGVGPKLYRALEALCDASDTSTEVLYHRNNARVLLAEIRANAERGAGR